MSRTAFRPALSAGVIIAAAALALPPLRSSSLPSSLARPSRSARPSRAACPAGAARRRRRVRAAQGRRQSGRLDQGLRPRSRDAARDLLHHARLRGGERHAGSRGGVLRDQGRGQPLRPAAPLPASADVPAPARRPHLHRRRPADPRPYTICVQNGCFAEFTVNDAQFRAIKGGKQLTIQVQNQAAREVSFVPRSTASPPASTARRSIRARSRSSSASSRRSCSAGRTKCAARCRAEPRPLPEPLRRPPALPPPRPRRASKRFPYRQPLRRRAPKPGVAALGKDSPPPRFSGADSPRGNAALPS